MQTTKNQNQISRQLEEIQTLLKQKDQQPLNFVEAAKYLSISQSTLYKLSYQRKIPLHKPSGKLLYFFKHELDEWIAKGNSEFRIENGELKSGRRKRRTKKHENKNGDDEDEPSG
ncbi:MAG: helix-turn-helix domain-containing protein [Bacteroidota bacterium]